MSTFDAIAAATVRIECGDSSGTGFHFVTPGTFVTCYHVIDGDRDAVEAVTEDGERIPLRFVDGSPSEELDYAVFRAQGTRALPLLAQGPRASLGLPVLFAGYPHGFPELLVQKATVAGFKSDEAIYLDGSVNEGNSGGPVVDADSGVVVGVITATRFPGLDDLEALAETAAELYATAADISEGGGGADLAKSVAQTNILLHKLLLANANSGIGIALRIEEVMGAIP